MPEQAAPVGPAANLEMFSLSGGVLLVTGAAGGIGSALAVGLAQLGAQVGCLDRPGASLATTVDAIREAGGRALLIEADVTDPAALGSAVADTERVLGPLTGAVNCAGVNAQVAAYDMTEAQWRSLMDVNVNGVFHACQAEGRALRRNGGGSIVNIGSISAHIANRGLAQAHYNSSKAAVLQLSKSLALEWAPDGVRVNSLSPGYTATPMARHPDVWPHVQAYIADIPLARMAAPEELVGPAAFLLGAASSYVTATDLLVDGGACAW
jgi:NAD(P)-dependent dehydrogenase (short-subunit alcohol dehydrogenase family)